MSIADILDNISTNGGGPSICELGKIKIGGKKKEIRATTTGSTWRAPEKYDHFVITTMNRDAAGDLVVDRALMDQLAAKYGDADKRLRQIPIRLLSDDIDDVIQSSFVWYGGKSIGARSDGKTVTWFNSPNIEDFGTRYREPITSPWSQDLNWKDKKGNPLFKVHTNFNCVIAAEEARWGGVYKFRTTSIISLRQLHGSIVHIAQLTGGILVGMPLMMVVRPMQVSPNGTATTVHVVHIELRGGDLMDLQERALSQAKFRVTFANQIQSTSRQYKKLLALPGYESHEEAKDIQEEFAPEEAELQTMPSSAPYGILDGADAPPSDPEIPSEALESSDGPNAVAEPEGASKKPETNGKSAPPIDVGDMSAFRDALAECAMLFNVPSSVFDAGFSLLMLIDNAKATQRSKYEPARRRILEAAMVGKIDWQHGRLL